MFSNKNYTKVGNLQGKQYFVSFCALQGLVQNLKQNTLTYHVQG